MRTRVLIATLAAAAFAAPLAWLLAATVPASSRRPLTNPSASTSAFPVEIPELRYLRVRGGGSVHRIRLTTRRVEALASHSQIRLLVATYGTRPSLHRAGLAIEGTDCVFRTLPGAAFPNNGLVTLVRGAGCGRGTGSSEGGMRLTVEFDTPARAAVWADPGTDQGIDAGALVVSDRLVPESARRPMLRGTLVDVDPSNRRSRAWLLAYMWNVASSARWIWIALAVSAALGGLAVFVLSGARGAQEDRRRAVGRAMAGGFLAAAALTLAYATLVPPFQSADEPNHFAGFAAFVHRADIDADAARWARATHFERIQFHPEEHFTPADVGVPGEPWNDGTVPDPSLRGAAVQWLWRLVPPPVRALPAPWLLLALRWIDALLFAIAVALFLGLVAASGERRPDLLAIPLFLVPTLPFFAMTVSNYGPLTAAYVLVSAGIVLDLRDARGAEWSGPLIGGGWMIASLTARSALPLAPFIAAWLAGRLVVGRRDARWRLALIYWVGAAACLAPGVWLADRAYVDTTLRFARSAIGSAIADPILAPTAFPWLLLAAGLVGAAAEHAMSMHPRTAPARARETIRRGAIAAPLLMIAVLAGSLVYRYPTLAVVDPANAPPPAAYVKDTLAAGVTMFRLSRPDFLTSWSFWGGFGWLETLPPAPFVAALAASSGLALAGLVYVLARRGELRALVRVAFALAGAVASLAAYALSVIVATPADVHGRYLLGLYLCVLVIGWSVVARIAGGEGMPTRSGVIRGASLTAFVAVHVISLAVILTRYF